MYKSIKHLVSCVVNALKIIKGPALVFGMIALTAPAWSQVEGWERCAAQHLAKPPVSTENFPLGFRSIVTIPVVVHVVWNSEEENISDAQIFSQIAVLNEDFRAQNIEVPSIPSVFQPLIADVEFEFCLAKVDPAGNATTGITRTFTQNSVGIGGSTDLHYTSQGGRDAWDTQRYLNIYVAKFAGGIGGTASFPGEGPAAEQAVEINYRQFGTTNVDEPYHLGRTCTHEIGHYFNLEHPWGPGFNDCCEDDFVADTPEACDTYLGECPSFPISSCSGPDMFMNFMFYTNDDCMGMFTPGQVGRMLAALNEERSGLLEGQLCEVVSVIEKKNEAELVVFGNPASRQISFSVRGEGGDVWDFRLIDLLGRSYFQGKISEDERKTVDLAACTAGVYFIVLDNNGRFMSQRLMIF